MIAKEENGERKREKNKWREDRTLGFKGHGSSRRWKISQQGRQRSLIWRVRQRAEQVQGSTGWAGRLDEEDWSLITVLAKCQRRVMSEADLIPGQSLVAFSYRGQ